MPRSTRPHTRLALAVAALAASLCGAAAHAQTELVIATVNNGHMIEMQKLSKNFEQANPDIKLKWVTLEEGVLRQRVTTDIATKGGQFDVMTIGMYEAPIWGKKGWLQELKTDAAYDVDDLLPAVRNGLSIDGKLFAAQVERGVGKNPLAIRIAHNGTRLDALVLSPRTAELHALMPYKAPPDMSRYVLSPMPGLLVDVAVQPGQKVQAGEKLAVIEAMKMENILFAAQDGVVGKIVAGKGESLAVDQVILEFQ